MLSYLAWFEVTLVVYFWGQPLLIYVKLICPFGSEVCVQRTSTVAWLFIALSHRNICPWKHWVTAGTVNHLTTEARNRRKRRQEEVLCYFIFLATSNKLWSWNRKPICAFILHPINLHRLFPLKAKIYFKQYLSEQAKARFIFSVSTYKPPL